MRLASAVEQQFWFAEQITPGTLANVTMQSIRLEGPLDYAVLAEAFRVVVRRHEALRTGFMYHGGRLLVRTEARNTAPPSPVLLPSGAPNDVAVSQLLTREFDLQTGDLIRLGVVPTDYGALLHVAAHHIAYDGLSHEIFTRDLALAYGAGLNKDVAELPLRPRMPAMLIDEERRAAQLAYWRATLSSHADLPVLGAAPSQWELAEARLVKHQVTCDAALVRRLRLAAGRRKVMPFTLLLTAYGQAIADIAGGADFCVAVAVALRGGERIHEVGCEINTVPVRVREPLAEGAAERVWEAQSGAFSHSDVPFADIVTATRTAGRSRLALAQTSLIYQGWKRAAYPAGPATMRTVMSDPLGAQFEVQMLLCLTEDGQLALLAQAPLPSGWTDHLVDLTRAMMLRLRDLTESATTQPSTGRIP
ncbi:condensation domain-containing protein [Micromonospora sp. NPDC051196]|uniref:condensation domain-containing protein n=1 Tax=Micromonospora sp. NPDC051196 TaxID=3155281 RepID=UPI00344835B6